MNYVYYSHDIWSFLRLIVNATSVVMKEWHSLLVKRDPPMKGRQSFTPVHSVGKYAVLLDSSVLKHLSIRTKNTDKIVLTHHGHATLIHGLPAKWLWQMLHLWWHSTLIALVITHDTPAEYSSLYFSIYNYNDIILSSFQCTRTRVFLTFWTVVDNPNSLLCMD